MKLTKYNKELKKKHIFEMQSNNVPENSRTKKKQLAPNYSHYLHYFH
jgi:hypothetical protein